jgi:nitronate monooxygenase
MSSSFQLSDLSVPVIVAPMAGGPSTPELAAAAPNAGGLGFVAAGYLSADTFAERVVAARKLTSGPLGVNLFVPQPNTGTSAQIQSYAAALSKEAEHYGVALGEPRYDDDGWSAKLDAVLDLRPEVASFTFGLPGNDECDRLRRAGIATVATVTTVGEARMAVGRGVDVIAVLPVVAAGGLMTGEEVAGVIRAGAAAAQLGTAFLLSDESGSSPVHRAALQNPQFTETAVTKAFTGRYARGLRNRFIDEHDAEAPLAYPQIHYLTSPLRAASVRAGDPHAINIWAGTGFRKARTGSVASIMEALSCR